jgi:predicted phosphodiesterase
MKFLLSLSVFFLFVGCSSTTSFLGLGDWGGVGVQPGQYDYEYAGRDEKAVANQMMNYTEFNPVDFVLAVGDNFYNYGVQNASDSQFAEDFENVFTSKSMMVPWYVVLGNHDYALNSSAQIQYKSPNEDRWNMPNRYYTKRIRVSNLNDGISNLNVYVTFVFLDTSPCIKKYRSDSSRGWDPPCTYAPPNCNFHKNILSQDCGLQYEWLKEIVRDIPSGDWKIAVGHHPSWEIDVYDFTQVLYDSNFDLHIHGHTHALGYYKVDEKGSYVLTGAGSLVKVKKDRNKPKKSFLEIGGNSNVENLNKKHTNHYHDHQIVWYKKMAGFTYHEFNDKATTLTTKFIVYNGTELYSFQIKKE